ncbi:MAG: histidine phosphatase family protein [Clostridia bacterium]|nr:histidine phosphatase family protein [Clostridia bacterium]
MVKILLVRHGQSLSNDSGTITGQIDSPLSNLGLKQAELVSNYIFKNYNVNAIYSSDLTRAVDTLKPLSNFTGLNINTTPDLRELDCGEWEGEKISDLLKNPLYVKWRDYDLSIKTPGGESFLDLQKRAKTQLDKIVKDNPNKTVAIVAHGGAIRMIFASILDIPTQNWKEKLGYVTNASVTVIEYDKGEYKIIKTVDDYLGELSTSMPKGL